MKKYLILSLALTFVFTANASSNYDDPPKSYQQAKKEMDAMCELEGKKATLKSASFSETTENSETKTRVGRSYNLGGQGEVGTKTGVGINGDYNSSRNDKSKTESASFERKYDFECE